MLRLNRPYDITVGYVSIINECEIFNTPAK